MQPFRLKSKKHCNTCCVVTEDSFKVLLQMISWDFHAWSHWTSIWNKPLQRKTQIGFQLFECCFWIINLKAGGREKHWLIVRRQNCRGKKELCTLAMHLSASPTARTEYDTQEFTGQSLPAQSTVIKTRWASRLGLRPGDVPVTASMGWAKSWNSLCAVQGSRFHPSHQPHACPSPSPK